MRDSATLVHFLRTYRLCLSSAHHTFIIVEQAPDARKVNDLLLRGILGVTDSIRIHPKKLIREPFYRQAAKSAKDLQQKQESLVW